jgi:AMP phosphorylase
MALYLKAKKLDIEAGDPLSVLINTEDAELDGLLAGDRVWLTTEDYDHICYVKDNGHVTVEKGSIGLFADIWKDSGLTEDSYLRIERISTSKSVEYIAKKLQGLRLTEDEMYEIMDDISNHKLRSAEMAYFMATMFNPGFSDEEALYAIKGMVKSGEILDFKDIKNNGEIVVDKHSIGGVAGKGITPLLVPIIASFGLVIPNTSTRAITAPAGTTDILEVIMPVKFDGEKIKEVVRKTGASLVWGGNLNIAPADDILIRVEKGLKVQCYQKFIISIVAKKLAMGISHILIDLPYGVETKVEEAEDIELVSNAFEYFFDKVGIKSKIYTRKIVGPDGRSIGPNLEIQEVLKILENHKDKSVELEESVIKMSAALLEFSGKAKEGLAEEMIRERMESGKIEEKFWEIAFAQGCKEKIYSDDISVGKEAFDVIAMKEGKIKRISNKEVVKLARALGNPNIKEAGIYFHKFMGEDVKKGDIVATFYSINNEAIKAAKDIYEEEKLFIYA